MNFRIILICFFLIFLTGCEGPAEQAGENLDEQVTAARKEVEDLKRQVDDYKQTIKQTREELADSKEQLALARQELEETKLSRQEILQQMASVQKKAQAEATPEGRQNTGEHNESSASSETLNKPPDETGNTGSSK